MLENIKRISNPLTIIAIFAGLAEIASTTALVMLDKEIQGLFVWFVMLFPVLLVTLFFVTLNFNSKSLYAPSDFKDESNFVDINSFNKNISLENDPGGTSSTQGDKDYERLATLATELNSESRSGFTPSERDEILELLDRLSAITDITNRKDFAITLEKVIDTFVKADLDYEVDKLCRIYKDITENRSGIVHTLILHYGMRLVGTNNPSPEVVAAFNRYASLAKRFNVLELALPFQIVHAHSGNDQTTVENLLGDARGMSERDKERFLELFERLSDPKAVAKRTTGTVARMTDKFQAFMKSNAEVLRSIKEAG